MSFGPAQGGASASGSDIGKSLLVTRLTDQTIGDAGSGDFVSFTAEVADEEGISAVGAGANVKIATFTLTGRYRASGYVHFAADADGYRYCGFQVFNSSDALKTADQNYTQVNAAASGGQEVPVQLEFDVVSGDYLKLYVYHNAGGNLAVNPVRARVTRVR